jgi:heme-degrading monooxygenase HmoA
MVITVLEARVDPEEWQALEARFTSEVKVLDPGIMDTFLVQSKSDSNAWQIITVWENQAALDGMRASGETPRGVLIFRSANAQPTLSIFRVVSRSLPQSP